MTLRLRQPRCDPRHPGHRHKRQHDGGARLCQPGAYGVPHDRRPADALPRVLRPRAQPDAGARARRSARSVPSRCRRGGRAVLRNRSLVLAHCWLAFAVFAAASVLGVWQMWVRSPLHAPYAEPGKLLPVGDRAWRVDGLRADDVLYHGFRLFRRRDCARSGICPECAGPGPGSALGVIGTVLAVADDPRRPRLGALHLLSAADGEPVLLHRAGAGRSRVVDLVRDHDRARWRSGSAPIPGAGPARDVRARSRMRSCGCGPPSGSRSSYCFR